MTKSIFDHPSNSPWRPLTVRNQLTPPLPSHLDHPILWQQPKIHTDLLIYQSQIALTPAYNWELLSRNSGRWHTQSSANGFLHTSSLQKFTIWIANQKLLEFEQFVVDLFPCYSRWINQWDSNPVPFCTFWRKSKQEQQISLWLSTVMLKALTYSSDHFRLLPPSLVFCRKLKSRHHRVTAVLKSTAGPLS